MAAPSAISAFHEVARIRLKNGKYKRHRLGKTNDRRASDGINAICYFEALKRAERWFSDPAQATVATDTFPVGIIEETLSCPIGDIYTIGHAIRDYLAWKKVIAKRTHFHTLLNHANYHILPRIGTIALHEFNGTHLQRFVKDVLETPPKRGNQKRKPRIPLSELSDEDMRKRKKTVNALIGILRQAVQLA